MKVPAASGFWNDNSVFAEGGFYAARDVRPSPTLAVAALAKKMKSEGLDVVDMSVGEPDFVTPRNVMDAATKAMQLGDTKYTDVPGSMALRRAVAKWAGGYYGFNFEPENVGVSCGAKQSIFNILFCTLRPGDEVIIPKPYWVSYPDMVMLAGGISVFCDCGADLLIDLASLEQAITDRTKWIIINYPSNPSGAVCSRDFMRKLADLLLRYPHVNILSDDIYSSLVYDQDFVSVLHVEPSLLSRVVIVNGVSKSYAMTGWRIGYVIGHGALVKKISAFQSQVTSCPSSISQAASIEALSGDQGCVSDFVAKFKKRRDFAVAELSKVPGMRLEKPGGAFYLFPSCQQLIGRPGVEDDVALSNFFLEKFLVSSVPGSAFGAPGYVRFSYALSDEGLSAGCGRIVEACKAILG